MSVSNIAPKMATVSFDVYVHIYIYTYTHTNGWFMGGLDRMPTPRVRQDFYNAPRQEEGNVKAVPATILVVKRGERASCSVFLLEH